MMMKMKMCRRFNFPSEYLKLSNIDFLNKFIELLTNEDYEIVLYSESYFLKFFHWIISEKVQLQYGYKEKYKHNDFLLQTKQNQVIFVARWDSMNKIYYDNYIIDQGAIIYNDDSFIHTLKKFISNSEIYIS